MKVGKSRKRSRESSTKRRDRDRDDGAKGPARDLAVASAEVWSKSKKKRMRMQLAKKKKLQLDNATDSHSGSEKLNSKTSAKTSPMSSSSSALQDAFKARLSGSRFRVLNEELYTATSSDSFKRFNTNPELYEQYHDGFRHQVESWPVNPIEIIVQRVRKQRSLVETIDSQKPDRLVVADFGCGDAELTKTLLETRTEKDEIHGNNSKKKGPHLQTTSFLVHSFDLVASCELVTACDMAHVPLGNATVDVAVFCLSLMGTNLADFIREAHRVLKPSGLLLIAEVRSRFESRHKGKDELQEFIVVLEKLGFQNVKTDRSNKMFVLLELRKSGKKPSKALTFTAKPCIYKRR